MMYKYILLRMTEQDRQDKYIKCKCCKCKYINDEEHISKDFGYTRLEERYKTCVKCRASKKNRSKLIAEIKNKQILITTTPDTDSGSGSSYITDSGSGSSYYTDSE